MRQFICVYCGATSSKRFPKEHVLPQAFGKFENNLVLRCVCGGCNSYFSRELELFLARDTFYAILRARYGITLVDVPRTKKSRIKMTIKVPGPWDGMRVILRPDPGGKDLISEQISQVAFKRPGEDWRWFLDDELTEDTLKPFQTKGIHIKIIGPSAEAMQRLRDKLKQMKIKFQEEGVLDQPITENGKVQVYVETQVDQVILRGIAKIGFNYLAYTKGADFVLRSDFDLIRNYVREGKLPANAQFVGPVKKPILAGDTPSWSQTNGHVVTCQWDQTRYALLGQVALFNTTPFHVLLCHHYTGLWHDFSSGHHFDIEHHWVSELKTTSLIKPVQIRYKTR